MVDDLGMSHPHDIHDRINALCAQARRLAPKVADQALDSGCTNDRPTGPRQAKAWDLIAEAFALNETTVPAEYSLATLYPTEETNDMTHYAEASKHEPITYEASDQEYERYDEERTQAIATPIPCPGYSLTDAKYIATAYGLRYVIRNTITGMVWATDHPFADVDAILWDAEKGL